MAHSVSLGALTEELVVVVLDHQANENSKRTKSYKDNALKALRNHSYGRTNQFEVRAQLDGLDEKFRVLNNDPLADALKNRLEKLDKATYQWKPEILSLLLNISDRPVTKTRIEDLELLQRPEPPPILTWADIIAEDPLIEEGIWDKPDLGDESSEDVYSLLSEENSKASQDPLPSTVDEVELSSVGQYVVEVDRPGLEAIEKAQFWRNGLSNNDYTNKVLRQENSQQITELHAIRECIFMLSGLRTHLFQLDHENVCIKPRAFYSIKHLSSRVLNHVLLEFAKIGSTLRKLRQRIQRKVSVPLIQTFYYTIERRLQQFHQTLGRIEQRFVVPSDPVIVSLQAVLSEVNASASYVLDLADVVARVPLEAQGPHYACLELLYRQTCDFQMVGNMESFEYFARIFFECLQTYLRLVRLWMENGELDLGDETFFVYAKNQYCNISSIWHDQYALRKEADGVIHAPGFVQTVARKILNTGKSVAFLKAIGNHQTANGEGSRPRLDYESVCDESAQLGIAPFAEVFLTAFEQWVKHQHRSSAQTLHEQLVQQCGLWITLEVFEYIYFSKDGAVFQDFASGIFKRLDRRKEGLNDRYILTDLAQNTFEGIPGLDARRLTVLPRSSENGNIATSFINLAGFVVDYAYPWPVMNVIRKPTLTVYQQVFTFLLQILYAKHHLLLHELLPSTVHNKANRLAYSLRQRLLWFTNTFHCYITETVLTTSTAQMRERLAVAEDVDAMTEVHAMYITHLAAQCLLTKNLHPIHQAIESILELCSAFSEAQSIEAARLAKDGSRESFNLTLDHRKDTARPLRRPSERRITHVSDSEESDSDDGGEGDGMFESKKGQTLPYPQRIQQMLDQFDHLHGFITAGLNGISRAGGENSWEVLAEKLEWK